MKHQHFFKILLFSLCAALFAVTAHAEKPLNLDNELALQGYDPVSYTRNSPIKGMTEWQARHNGATYLFANKANLEAFQADPAAYEPAYGGWCAWAMLEGDKVDIDPKTYKIVNGKLFLFYNGFWGNTLEKWNTLAADQGEETLVTQADQRWNAF